MRSRVVTGIFLVLAGVLLLFFLRDLLFKLIVFVIGFLGIVVAFALIIGGLSMMLWRPSSVRRF